MVVDFNSLTFSSQPKCTSTSVTSASSTDPEITIDDSFYCWMDLDDENDNGQQPHHCYYYNSLDHKDNKSRASSVNAMTLNPETQGKIADDDSICSSIYLEDDEDYFCRLDDYGVPVPAADKKRSIPLTRRRRETVLGAGFSDANLKFLRKSLRTLANYR